jgi:hypothetical protein
MSIRKDKTKSKISLGSWTTIIPMILTTIGLIFGGYQWYVANKKSSSQKKTWEQNKQVYFDLVSLVGDIGANKNNDSMLQVLSSKFDAFFLAKMRHAKKNDSLITFYMMMMQKDMQNTINHKIDYYQPDKLGNTCKKLSDQVNEIITKGDKEY